MASQITMWKSKDGIIHPTEEIADTHDFVVDAAKEIDSIVERFAYNGMDRSDVLGGLLDTNNSTLHESLDKYHAGRHRLNALRGLYEEQNNQQP
jgi:hypothetical protein